MATNENVLPGVGFVSETGTTKDNVLPGYGFILETQAAAAGAASASAPLTPHLINIGRMLSPTFLFFALRSGILSKLPGFNVVFRKTLSGIGTGAGSRKTHN